MIDWLLGTLLATSLLALLVLALREPVRGRFGPSVAYALWLLPAARAVFPSLTHTVERIVAPATPMTLEPATAFVASATVSDPLALSDWPQILVILWLAGAAAMLVRGLLVYRAQRRTILANGVRIAGIGTIRIVRSSAVRGPMAFGLIDRVIVVPIDFDQKFSERQRSLALAHELAHHRSGDLVANSIAFVLLCLQWFNPLAWAAHAAFRFDQEAACDARVLDKASSDNRAAYAQAIAKAASGRALLFAGALDRPNTLHRRLRSMLSTPTNGRRTAGKALIAISAAAALPLTASRATEYVDVPAPQNAATASKAMPAVIPAVISSTSAAPAANASLPMPDLGGVTLGRNDVAFMADDTILIGGKRKTVEQLTPAERARLRHAIAGSKQDLVRDRERLPREIAEAKREADRARSGELRREHLRDIEDMRRELAEVDSRAAELRSEGEDPAAEKAEIMRDLHEAEATDIAAEERDAIEEDNPARREAEIRSEEQQMERLLARLNRLDRQ